MKIVLAQALSLALLAPCAVAGGDEDKVIPTTLGALRISPDTYRNVVVTFPVTFISLGKISNPFFTQFVPSSFANFYVWADEQPIWRKPAYDDFFGLMFLSKTHEQLQELYDLKLYTRLQVTGIVRNTFQEMPWIEVTSFTRIGGSVSTASLAHLYRGEQLMDKRQWQAAISELSLAPAADAPASLLAAVNKNLGICYLRLGEAGAAVQHLDSAVGYTQGTDRELEQLRWVAQANPKKEIDRSTSSRNVKDHERPLWEAFDEGARPAPPGR